MSIDHTESSTEPCSDVAGHDRRWRRDRQALRARLSWPHEVPDIVLDHLSEPLSKTGGWAADSGTGLRRPRH